MSEFDAGTAADMGAADPGTDADQSGTATPDSPAGATAAPGESGLETLLDPATLPDELKPHWSRMTQAYNKRLDSLRRERGEVDSLRQKAAVVDRFYNDPAYARQVVEQRAQQLGMPLGAASPSAPAPAGSSAPSAVPAHVLQAVQASLADDPQLAFMAPTIAKAAWAVAQQSVAPLQQERQQQQAQQRQAEYTQLVQQLATKAPGWDAYEDEMHGRVSFLREALNGTGPLSHPQYGNLLEVLYRWASGAQFATGDAASRMQKAVLNKTTTGTAAPAKGPSTEDLIAKAPGAQDKWQIAFQAALREAQQAP